MNEQQDFSYIKHNLESIRARADAAAAASPYGQSYELLLATIRARNAQRSARNTGKSFFIRFSSCTDTSPCSSGSRRHIPRPRR